MVTPIRLDDIFYSSHTLSIENTDLTVTLDNGLRDNKVEKASLHSHPVFELQAVLRADMMLDLAERESIRLCEHDLCLIPPDTYHGVRPLSDTERITLRFSCERNAAEGCADLYRRFHGLTEVTVLRSAREFIPLLLSIRAEILAPQTAGGALMRAYLTELFVHLFRALDSVCETPNANPLSESDDENARYNKIELLMQWRMAEIFREQDLAEVLGLSVRQTSRVMQRIFGMSFRKKLLEIRMHRAAELLLTTDDAVDQIGAAVGYTSPSGFHVAFCKAFGCTPGEYRERNTASNFKSRT